METEAIRTLLKIQGFTVYKVLAHGFLCEDDSFVNKYSLCFYCVPVTCWWDDMWAGASQLIHAAVAGLPQSDTRPVAEVGWGTRFRVGDPLVSWLCYTGCVTWRKGLRFSELWLMGKIEIMIIKKDWRITALLQPFLLFLCPPSMLQLPWILLTSPEELRHSASPQPGLIYTTCPRAKLFWGDFMSQESTFLLAGAYPMSLFLVTGQCLLLN